MVKDDDKTLAMLAHLLSLFIGLFSPLIFYLIKKDSSFVRENARNALNFQISLIIYFVITFAMMLILIGFILLPILWVFSIIVTIIGSIRAYEGEIYEYPLTIKFIK